MDRGEWENLARMPRLHPYIYSKKILGYLMSTDSQDLGPTSHPKDGAFRTVQYPRHGALGSTQTTG